MRMVSNGRSTRRGEAGRGAAGFTIIELLVSIAVIAILIGLLIVVGRIAIQQARKASAQRTVQAMRQGVEQFRQDHGFLPPLIADEATAGMPNFRGTPIYNPNAGEVNPIRPVFATYRASLANDPQDPNKARERDYLRGWTTGNQRVNADDYNDPADRRFSNYSLGVYLAGLGEVTYGNANPREVVDGVVGPGSVEPLDDGTWAIPAGTTRARSGKKYGSRFQDGSGGFKVVDADIARGQNTEGRVEIRDRNGVAIRYYRWLRGERGLVTENLRLPNGSYDASLLNIPRIVGDPGTNPELASADFAIVAAGADGFFGDMPVEATTAQAREAMAAALGIAYGGSQEQLVRKAREDNVVEVGR